MNLLLVLGRIVLDALEDPADASNPLAIARVGHPPADNLDHPTYLRRGLRIAGMAMPSGRSSAV